MLTIGWQGANLEPRYSFYIYSENRDEFNRFSDTGKVPVLEDNEIKEEFIIIAKKLISGGD